MTHPIHERNEEAIPRSWSRRGLAIARTPDEKGYGVVGDPCIVRDEAIAAWRMFVFADPHGQGEAVSLECDAEGLPLRWSRVEPLRYAEPLPAGRKFFHKPYLVQEAARPNQPARIGGEYWLLSVAFDCDTKRKDVYRARSQSLSGPWLWDDAPLIPTGGPGAFDEKHVDAVSGFYFPERGEVLYFYMGYPLHAQARQLSPFGNAQGLAVQRHDEPTVRKLGEFLPPSEVPGHWTGGYLGGFQLLPGITHRWIALLNGSPTPPDPGDASIACEEPAPSLGGWAVCDEAWPVRNWKVLDEPMERIEAIPEDAIASGEGTNLWRHHALVLPQGRVALYYNSGSYGREQLYLKVGSRDGAMS